MNFSAYLLLVDTLNRYSHAYYSGRSIVSDAEFDALYANLERTEAAHPEWIVPDSPTQHVGATPANGTTVSHLTPMLSLSKVHTAEDTAKHMANVTKKTACRDFVAMWKYDGISVSLVYLDGQLATAATRGNDGHEGNDITALCLMVPSIPQNITEKERVEVRGELLCPFSSFDTFKAEGYKTTRDVAAAMAATIAPDAHRAALLAFYPFETIGTAFAGKNIATGLAQCAAWGFNRTEVVSVSADTVGDVINDFTARRTTLPHPTDGIVVKTDSQTAVAAMGATAKVPRAHLAYKFESVTAVTTVTSIEIRTAASGKQTPVAHIVPVVLGGKTIRKVNLCTIAHMQRIGVTEGCQVVVELRNDVTPKIKPLATTIEGGEPETAAPVSPIVNADEEESPISPVPAAPAASARRRIMDARDLFDEEGRAIDFDCTPADEPERTPAQERRSDILKVAGVTLAALSVVLVAVVGIAAVGAAFFALPALAGAFVRA